MVRQLSIFLTLGLGLVACGNSPTSTLKTACIDNGGSDAECTCMVQQAEDRLTSEQLALYAASVASGDEAAITEDVSLADGAVLLAVRGDIVANCDIGL